MDKFFGYIYILWNEYFLLNHVYTFYFLAYYLQMSANLNEISDITVEEMLNLRVLK